MANQEKPFIKNSIVDNLAQIISDSNDQWTNNNQNQVSIGELKRIELIKRMKEDNDKTEYLLLLNILISVLTIISVLHYIYFSEILSLIVVFFGIFYWLYVRKRINFFVLEIQKLKENFDLYLWEGYFLKEMRLSAVKFGFFIFFPMAIIYLMDLIKEQLDYSSFFTKLVLAVTISTLGWFLFFRPEDEKMSNLESDLNALKYI